MSSHHPNSRNRKRARAKKNKANVSEASSAGRSTGSCSKQAQEQQQQQPTQLAPQPESGEQVPQQPHRHQPQQRLEAFYSKESSFDQDEKNRHKVTRFLDPVQCAVTAIPNKIFSYLDQKDCLKAMGVSELWMERVPIFCTNVWRDVELNEKAHDLENTLVHRCLGSHVDTLAFKRFSQQSRLLKMMRIARSCNCTDQTEIGNDINIKHMVTYATPSSTVFNACRIIDLRLFLGHFQPLTRNMLRIAFFQHGDVLSITRIMPVCPNLQSVVLAFKNKTHSMVPVPHPSSHHLPLSDDSVMYALTKLEIFTMLSITTLLQPRRSLNTGSNISCSSKELAAVIMQCPRLERLALHSTGDNLYPIVSNVISKLPMLQDFELHYGDETPSNHLDGGLHLLLSKHANLGSVSPLRRLSLNVTDGSTLLLVGKIVTLENIYLVNTFYDNASDDSLVRFAALLADNSSVQSLTLHQFDLRSRSIMNFFARITSLTVVDFTDCRLDRANYLYFLDHASSLTRVRQPNCGWDSLLSGPYEEVRLVDDNGDRLTYTVVNVERMPMSFLFKWRSRRDAYVVAAVTDLPTLHRYFSLI
ncbi:hypothetical protein BDB00DRAFT_880481 [Zychaea mexicana]|uniref:uncharacterized protein n=1 Tax=Zychaea mexicana TaxID=64656 RepID=UPI0022FED789|nr:uncharacterized protein BDB00DRAFT_880481 [Zychaea mexicana]KAI9467722.1 hypothetical protein BDB00DRAFT_880481 [Zychaea mexicana]